MTSSPENKITRSDLVKSAVNVGALGMEFSWTYYKQMNIAFCLMVANMLKKIYAGRPDDYAEALHRHCAFFNITVQFAPFVGGIAMAMEEKVARGEIEPESVNDVEGYAMLSKKRLDAVKVWEDIEEARENKTTLEGKVTEENKGGIVVNVKGVRVFVPASQSGQPRGADLSEMIGQTVSLRITEVNRARRRVVGSIRAVQYEARQAAQAAIWESIEVGKHYTGTVKSMTSYGVFVDIGGVDGMVHISELSWSRIKNPAEVVSVGDTLDVYVISFDPEKHKISLGVKDHSCNPWDTFMNTYKVGDVANVRIVKLMTFGAFAEVVPGVDGLIHISQIADRRIDKPGDVLSEGQMVDVKITAIDEEKQKISLSIRALLNDARAAEEGEDGEDA